MLKFLKGTPASRDMKKHQLKDDIIPFFKIVNTKAAKAQLMMSSLQIKDLTK